MPWFVKTETFTSKASSLTVNQKKVFIEKHKKWVNNLKKLKIDVISGYLVNENHEPGGGGLLILQAESY